MGNNVGFQNLKRIRMIPMLKMVGASKTSSITYGSGLAQQTGVAEATKASAVQGNVDTQGWDWAMICVTKNKGTALNASWKIYEQSARSTLIASATVFTSAQATAITASGTTHAYIINLNNTNRKRYLAAYHSCKTTSGAIEIDCWLTRGEQFPPTVTGHTTVRYI